MTFEEGVQAFESNTQLMTQDTVALLNGFCNLKLHNKHYGTASFFTLIFRFRETVCTEYMLSDQLGTSGLFSWAPVQVSNICRTVAGRDKLPAWTVNAVPRSHGLLKPVSSC